MPMKRIILTLLLASLLPLATAFAEINIKAEVDKNNITTDEILVYKLIIELGQEKNLPLKLPDFNGFKIISRSQSSLVNWNRQRQVKTSVIYIFGLLPYSAGKIIIQPAKLRVKDKTYQSEAIEVEIKPGKARPNLPQPKTSPVPDKTLPESSESQIDL